MKQNKNISQPQRNKLFIFIIVGLVITLFLITGCDYINPQKTPNTTATVMPTIPDPVTSPIVVQENVTITSYIKKMYIDIIDVGQGDSILIQTPNNKVVLIDCGDSVHGMYMVNYLKNKKIEQIDYLIVSHPHEDHIGGCSDIITQIKVINTIENIIPLQTKTYQKFQKNAMATNDKKIESDQLLDIGDPEVQLKLLVAYDTHGYYTNMNDNSIVTQINYGKNYITLSGDCELDCEKEVMEQLTQSLIYKVGHHGSATSSHKEFLQKIFPYYCVISVGEGNAYDHPDKITIMWLNNFCTELYRTDEDGTIQFECTDATCNKI